MNGRKPEWPTTFVTTSNTQGAEDRIKQINQAREEAQAAMKIASNAIQLNEKIHGKNGPSFQKGDKVWLEGKNIKNNYPTAKLAPKRFGPFEIIEEVGMGSYKIKLPYGWKIHPVFHASLLTRYVETEEHGPTYTRPPPDLIDGEHEHEVETIIKSAKRGRGWRYLVKWKGYPD